LVYGIHRALDNAGAVLGPLLAAGLLAMQVPLKEIFLWAIIPGVLTVALSLALKEASQPLPEMGPKFSWTMNEMPVRFKRYLLAVALFTLGCSSDMFLLLRAKDLGVSSSDVAFLWAGVNLIASIFSIPLSSLSDRWGRKQILLIGWSAYIIFYIAMGLLATASIWLFLIFAGYGLFKAATEGVEKALVADLAPEGLTGTAFGWFNLISGVMLFPASFIFGWLYESENAMYAFSFSAGCSFMALIVLYFWVYRTPKSSVTPA
jgi:MFS family permease